MSKFKRSITKQEFNEIRPYYKYLSLQQQENIEVLSSCIEMGVVLRTPIVFKIAENYTKANPGMRLPNCLRINAKSSGSILK